jgi:hypothetical protein
MKNLFIALAVAMVSTGAALADVKADDRSYLPPQDLQAQTKEPDIQAPKAERRLAGRHYRVHHSDTHRHQAHWRGRRDYSSRGFFPLFPGIFFGLFH